MSKISIPYLFLVGLLFFLAFLFQTTTTSIYVDILAFWPKLALFRLPLALVFFTLALLGLIGGIYNRKRAFILTLPPLGIFLFGGILLGCYVYPSWTFFFQIAPTQKLALSRLLGKNISWIFLVVVILLFSIYTISWFLLSRMPKRWEEDPFSIPSTSPKSPEFLFPGFQNKGKIPRCLRKKVMKKFDALNPYFESWNHISKSLQLLKEGKKYSSLSPMEMIRFQHVIRLFVIWRVLWPFTKTPNSSSTEVEELARKKQFFASSLHFCSNLHSLPFLGMIFLGTLATVGFFPIFGKPHSLLKDIGASQKSALWKVFGDELPLPLLAKKYDVIYLYEADCTKKNALIFQKGIEKGLKKDHRNVFFLFSKTFGNKEEKVLKTTFCFGVKKEKEPLKNKDSRILEIGKEPFQDQPFKVIVFRTLEGGHTEGTIEAELSYNLSKTFQIAKYNPSNTDAFLVVLGEDMGTLEKLLGTVKVGEKETLSEKDARKQRKFLIYQKLKPFLRKKLPSIQKKLEAKENILPLASKSSAYNLKSYIKYDASSNFDENSTLPYRVSIEIPRVRFSAKNRQCTFLYCLRTGNKIHLRVEYIEFFENNGKNGYRELRKTDFFVWKE